MEDPAALLEPLKQAGLAEELQVAGYSRLALAHDGGELADCQLGFAEQRQQAQPAGVGGGLEYGKKLLHHVLRQDINISLCVFSSPFSECHTAGILWFSGGSSLDFVIVLPKMIV